VEEPDSPPHRDGDIEEVDISTSSRPTTSRSGGTQAGGGNWGGAAASATDPITSMLQASDAVVFFQVDHDSIHSYIHRGLAYRFECLMTRF
jgi:hypothetical protein